MDGSNPVLAAFAEAVGKRYAPRDPASFWACEPLFRSIADPQFAEAVLNDGLRALAGDPAFARRWCGGTLKLATGRDDAWQLSLRLVETPRRYLHSVVRHALVAAVNGRYLRGDRYLLPPGFQNAVFDPTQKLVPDGRFEMAPGEVLPVHADLAVFDPQIETPVLLLMLETAPVTVLEWRFSRDTLHAWESVDGDPFATDLKLAAWLCGRLAHQSSLGPMKALATHADPGVRWAALQQLPRLSRVDARRLLEAAQADPHPVVRRSARQLLEHDSALEASHRLDPRWR